MSKERAFGPRSNCTKEVVMDIVYAAEKPSIARLLSEYMKRKVKPEEIEVMENPDETGSFFIGWHFERYVMSPSGEIVSNTLELVE
jgi:hypothetical protein